MLEILLIGTVVTFAAAVQMVAGFGFALVAIALLPLFLDLQLALPLMLLFSCLNDVAVWFFYRHRFRWQAVSRLVLSALATIPVGLWLLHFMNDAIALRALGALLLFYVAYDILQRVVPMRRRHPRAEKPQPAFESPYWAYAFGGIAGLLTGAFTISGPPLVMYANGNQWSAEEQKGNLPGVYGVVGSFALLGHYMDGHFTAELWQLAIVCIPFFGLGLYLGVALSRKVSASAFKGLVMLLLSVMGMRLAF